MTKQHIRLSPVPTNLINKLYVGPIIEFDARPTGVQFKRSAKLATVIGLITKHADCRIISNTFVAHDNFSEEKSALLIVFYCMYRPGHHRILVPIGPVAKEILIRHKF